MEVKTEEIFEESTTDCITIDTLQTIPDSFQSRINHVIFAANQKIYVGLGQNSEGEYLSDFWEYNPIPPSEMLRLDDFPAGGRTEATGFVIGNKIYIGAGRVEKVVHDDFYSYDITRNIWEQIDSIKVPNNGGRRRLAVSFSEEEKGYVLGGCNADMNPNSFSNTWRFDSSNPDTTWKPFNDAIWQNRCAINGFKINKSFYFGLGYERGITFTQNTFFKDYYKFTPSPSMDEERWELVTFDFEGNERGNFIAFSLNGRGYIGFGINSNGNILSDIWEFRPENNEWNKKCNAPIALAWTDAAVLNQQIYIIGGASSSNNRDSLIFSKEILLIDIE